jgi:hypothetical protein|tara:strand:- start:225 stop:725 length:501 start_codon:yes stop_codon:yes gene_type:complete
VGIFLLRLAKVYYSYEEITAEDWEEFAEWAYAENCISLEELDSLLGTKRYRFRAVLRCHENVRDSDDYCLFATYSRKSKVIQIGSFFTIGRFSPSAFACLIKSFKVDAHRYSRKAEIVVSDTNYQCHNLLKNMKFRSQAIRVPEYVGSDGVTSEHLYEFTYIPESK